MIVNSRQLEDGAKIVRARRHGPQKMPALGITVSAAQFDTAARILREADPCIANGISAERPGFIEKDAQDDPNVLTFQMGILPSTLYRIDRRGEVVSGEGGEEG